VTARVVELPGPPNDPDCQLAETALRAALAGDMPVAAAAVARLVAGGVAVVRTPAGTFEPFEGPDGWHLVAVPWRVDDRDRADLTAVTRLR
jgi:hypothetical protein